MVNETALVEKRRIGRCVVHPHGKTQIVMDVSAIVDDHLVFPLGTNSDQIEMSTLAQLCYYLRKAGYSFCFDIEHKAGALVKEVDTRPFVDVVAAIAEVLENKLPGAKSLYGEMALHGNNLYLFI